MARLLSVLVAVLMVWGCATQTVERQTGEQRHWQALENNPNCVVWNDDSLKTETATWSGACVDGKTQGSGTSVWRVLINGDWQERKKYTGEMKDGKFRGHGIYVGTSGYRYEGEFRDGLPHGHGVVMFASGDKFESDWINGIAHGHGVFVYANGGKYEGGIRDNIPHGHGVWVKENGDRYEGGYKDGKEHGSGVLVFASGNRYEGEWINGIPQGHGIYVGTNEVVPLCWTVWQRS